MKRSSLVTIVFVLSAVVSLNAQGQSLSFHTKRDGQCYQMAVTLDGADALTCPAEGLWSIATDWKDGWPADWVCGLPYTYRGRRSARL